MSDTHSSGAVGESAPARSGAPGTGRDQNWAGYIAEIRAGDAGALARLYDESSPVLFSLAVRMLADRADAEEVVLDVYAQVWRSAGTFDPARAGAAGWLILLCRSRCIDRLRSRAGRERPGAVPDSAGESGAVTSFFSADRVLVRRALAGLSQEHREILELAYFMGYTHPELAERLSLPLGTVKTRIRTALLRMRDLLQEFSS